ncbi:MAG: hypothetical protein JWO88_3328 [Frankiales bacterium]|jgi:hypothetical protein|nr:hypothetical protein [Frankiales bacterium]
MTATASQTTQHEAIVATARDYYEGWFDGDGARMERALHPELVKRSLSDDRTGIDTIPAKWMIDAAGEGRGRRDDADQRRINISVDHVYGAIATVSVTGTVYVDYLQLVEIDGRWRILNVLWCRA